MSTCVYYNNPQGEAEEAAARRRAARSKDTAAKFGRPGQSMYPPEWVANPQGSPTRQRWLERMAELGFLEPPTRDGGVYRSHPRVLSSPQSRSGGGTRDSSDT